jgi:serine/threonine protein kinase
MIHLDIKPENMAFSKEQKRYIFLDFGLSKLI